MELISACLKELADGLISKTIRIVRASRIRRYLF